MFGFFKKLLGLDKVDQKSEDPIVKLGPEPTEKPVGFIAQEVASVVPEAVVTESKPEKKVRPEVAASAEAAWPFPTTKPDAPEKKKPTPKSTPKKKPAPAKKAAAIKAPAKKKKKPASK